jgi:lipoate---protein ligase
LTTTISSTTSVDAKSKIAARIDARSLYVGKTTEIRVPRHDTPQRLPAEPPRDALARDEALLDQVQSGGAWLQRAYIPSAPAVVVGLGMRHRLPEVIDLERCEAAGVQVLERRAGGGAVLVDASVVCGAICAPLPSARIGDDLTQSYRWLGERFAEGLRRMGVADARRVEVAEARADVERLKGEQAARSKLLLRACYGALSPHEVVAGGRAAKIVGLAQVRRRHAVLFQFGILLQDQSPLADFLRVADEAGREQLRAALRRRTVGLAQLVEPSTLKQKIARLSVFAAASAAWDATPCGR